jgi:undecaprenyl pyrophosphate phosphatase UppP
LAASIAVRVSRLSDVNDRRLWAVMAVVVVCIWLVGAAVTKYSLERMAYYTPIAVVVVGATVGLVLLWVKVITDSLRRRRREG